VRNRRTPERSPFGPQPRQSFRLESLAALGQPPLMAWRVELVLRPGRIGAPRDKADTYAPLIARPIRAARPSAHSSWLGSHRVYKDVVGS
jgi:hypothetical protein